MSNSETISHILTKIKPDLEKTLLADGIIRFGGHPLRVILDGKEIDFWSEFVRVDKGKNRTLVFRVITRSNDITKQGDLVLRGVHFLMNNVSTNSHIIAIDNRSNLEREIEPGTKSSRPTQTDDLRQTYQKLLNCEIDVLLTPVREGALGSTEMTGNVGPFSEELAKNDPRVWDISEEIQVARLMRLALSEINSTEILNFLRYQISNQYHQFALPLSNILNSQLQMMDLNELPDSLSEMEVDISFFSDQEQAVDIDLGFGSKKVEQVIAYPYPTANGILYSRLFRVWNVQGTQFEVVRVLQTKSSLNQIDGLRIDSSCVDGVHSLDCHCDCKAQLEQAVYDQGLKIGKNVVIIQMADHEGKAWGSVLKGAGTHRPVREYNNLNSADPIHHVDVAAQFYNALGVPHDNRTYGAAQAVVLFLGIKKVEELFMDNNEKIKALEAAGITYKRKKPLYPDESKLTDEANRVNEAKKAGKIKGTDGKPVLYQGI